MMNEVGNYEMGCYMSALFFLSPKLAQHEKEEAYESLKTDLTKMGAEESPEKYLKLSADGVYAIVEYYSEKALYHFSKKDIDQYDHYVQRSVAIRTLIYDSRDIIHARKYTRELISMGIYDARVKFFEIERDRHFPIESIKDATRDAGSWLDDPNKLRLADVVSSVLLNMPNQGLCCLELGCHAGALLELIKRKAENQRTEIAFIGIEPDLMAVQAGKKLFPHLDIRSGNHEILASERNRLPDRISVFVLSSILLLCSPSVVVDILSFARDNVDTIVIMDDIANINGEYAVFRRKYILHPFVKLLQKYKFKDISLACAREPNAAITGIIVAENNNLG